MVSKAFSLVSGVVSLLTQFFRNDHPSCHGAFIIPERLPPPAPSNVSMRVTSVPSVGSATLIPTRNIKQCRKRLPKSTLSSNNKHAESVSAEERSAKSDTSSDFQLPMEGFDEDGDSDGDAEATTNEDFNAEVGMSNTELRSLQNGTRSKRARLD
jgi:hypothetical protein